MEKIVAIVYMGGVLLLILPAFLSSNNNFKTFITSTQYAHSAVEEGLEYLVDNTNLLEIENHFQEEVTNNSNLIDEDFSFNKGDTLLDFLYVPGAKRKEISSAIKSFSVSII